MLIYLAEEGGLRARFWEAGFGKHLSDHKGEGLVQDQQEVWFPTEMRAVPAGKGKTCPQAGRQALGTEGCLEGLGNVFLSVQRNNKGVSIKAGLTFLHLIFYLLAYSSWSS